VLLRVLPRFEKRAGTGRTFRVPRTRRAAAARRRCRSRSASADSSPSASASEKPALELASPFDSPAGPGLSGAEDPGAEPPTVGVAGAALDGAAELPGVGPTTGSAGVAGARGAGTGGGATVGTGAGTAGTFTGGTATGGTATGGTDGTDGSVTVTVGSGGVACPNAVAVQAPRHARAPSGITAPRHRNVRTHELEPATSKNLRCTQRGSAAAPTGRACSGGLRLLSGPWPGTRGTRAPASRA
jgi:hypothetical protein